MVTLEVPVIQTRSLAAGETVGYGNAWTAQRDSRVATIAAGYADGLHRALQNAGIQAYVGHIPCPVIGRISMDLITVDVTDLGEDPEVLTLINEDQTVDRMAAAAGTIGYEILTSLGHRYARTYSA